MLVSSRRLDMGTSWIMGSALPSQLRDASMILATASTTGPSTGPGLWATCSW